MVRGAASLHDGDNTGRKVREHMLQSLFSMEATVVLIGGIPWWEPLEQHRQTLAVG